MIKTLYILFVLALMSCSRQVHKASSETMKDVNQQSNSVDTSTSFYVKEQSQTVKYGDRLHGSFFIPIESVKAPDSDSSKGELVAIDSIVSDGIKLRFSVSNVKGGLKANVEAIAKPVSLTNSVKESVKVENGISASSFSGTTEKSKSSNKQVENEGFPWKLIIFLITFIIISIILINKKFENENSKKR